MSWDLFFGKEAASVSPTGTMAPPIASGDSSNEFGVPDSLVNAVIGTESSGNPDAVSFKGAQGLMQIMPKTAKDIAEKLGDPYSEEMLKDSKWNKRWGTYYIKEGLDRYGGDPRFALIHYHSGPSGADRVWKEYQKTGKFVVPRISRFYDGLSYTADYVDKIMKDAGDVNYSPENTPAGKEKANNIEELSGWDKFFGKKAQSVDVGGLELSNNISTIYGKPEETPKETSEEQLPFASKVGRKLISQPERFVPKVIKESPVYEGVKVGAHSFLGNVAMYTLRELGKKAKYTGKGAKVVGKNTVGFKFGHNQIDFDEPEQPEQNDEYAIDKMLDPIKYAYDKILGKDIKQRVAQKGAGAMHPFSGAPMGEVGDTWGSIIGQTAPQIGASQIPHVGMPILMANEAESFYQQGRELGIPEDINDLFSQLYGGTSGAIESVQGKLLAKPFKKPAQKVVNSILKKIGVGAIDIGTEGLAEGSQGLLQNKLLELAVKVSKKRDPEWNPNIPVPEYGWDQWWRDFGAGAGLGGLSQGGGVAVNTAVDAGKKVGELRTKEAPQTAVEGDLSAGNVEGVNASVESGVEQVAKPLSGESQKSKDKAFPKPEVKSNEGGFIGLGDPKNNPVVENIKKFVKEYFTSKGNKPSSVFEAMVKKDGTVSALMDDVDRTLVSYNRAAKEAYQGRKPTDEERFSIDRALKDPTQIPTLPKPLQPVVENMRQQIDALSQEMIDKEYVGEEMAETLRENLGEYATRSYRVFNDKKWAKRVKKDERILGPVRKLIRDELSQVSPDSDIDENRVEGVINELLDKDAVGDLFGENSRLGTIPQQIFKRRKEIPPEIRALWGEYQDADVNYSKSVQRMTQVIANSMFVDDVVAAGKGKYLFEDATGEYAYKIGEGGSKKQQELGKLFTTKELRNELHNKAAGKTPWPLRYWYKANAISKKAKTVYSPASTARNFTSNVSFALLNGHHDVKKFKTAFSATIENLRKDKSKYRAYLRELKTLGVLEPGMSGEIIETVKDANFSDLDEVVDKSFRSALRRADKGATDVYQSMDVFWKIYAYENELKSYKKAGLSDVAAKKRAAENVSNITPTYSRIPKAGQMMRRFPMLGPFVSFPMEVVRTTKNSMKIAIGDMKSDNAKVKKLGKKRLASIISTATLPTAVSIGSALLAGVDREEKEAYRSIDAPWRKNSQKIWLPKDKDGNRHFIDLGNNDPHSYMKRIIVAGLNGESYGDAFAGILTELMEPYVSEEIATSSLLNVRSNKKKDGTPIYNPHDDFEGILQDVTLYLWDKNAPGAWASAKRIYKAFNDDSNPGLYGSSYSKPGEITALGTGVRVSQYDLEKALYYRAGEYKRSKRVINGLTYKRGVNTKDEKLVNAQSEFASIITKLKAAGMSDQKIRKILRDRKFPYTEIGNLLRSTKSIENTTTGSQESDLKEFVTNNVSGNDYSSMFRRVKKYAEKRGYKISRSKIRRWWKEAGGKI